MLIFSIIIYTLFGGMCLWFIISGVQKLKSIHAEQESAAAIKSEKALEQENTAEDGQQENEEINS